jgi:lipoprotein-releasing system ATP-binding protein
VAEALVLVEQLSKSFQHMGRTLEVLRGIDLNIYHAEILSIVGPSGAGKSTLLHCMGTLDLPTSGRIRLAGEELTALGSSRLAAIRNRTIGFVFQFHHLLPEFTALENVMMPALLAGVGMGEARRRAGALLGEVGLAARETHKPRQLSGGEQQRVAVARALVNEPLVLLADEPSGNLDTHTSERLHDLLFGLRARRELSIVVVTHNADLAGRADRILRLEDGRLLTATRV